MKRKLRPAAWALVACLIAAPAIIAAEGDPAEVEQRHQAAVAKLTDLGAQIQVRSHADGGEWITVTTDGLWKGGDAGLEALADVRGLTKLRLGGRVTDEGLVHVGQLKELTSLDVHVAGITDTGIGHLRGLTELTRLNLTYTRVTDAGLEDLVGMNKLDWLGLSYTRVTAAGVGKLKARLADTIIEGNWQNRAER